MVAESEGFEPPIAFRLCLISSQMHSTGLCQLSCLTSLLESVSCLKHSHNESFSICRRAGREEKSRGRMFQRLSASMQKKSHQQNRPASLSRRPGILHQGGRARAVKVLRLERERSVGAPQCRRTPQRGLSAGGHCAPQCGGRGRSARAPQCRRAP
jgi:hypothetical protein